MTNSPLSELLAEWKKWSFTAEQLEDGWESSFPKWDSLMAAAKDAMISAKDDIDKCAFECIEQCWSISEEGEELSQFAADNIRDFFPLLCRLAHSERPSVRWQVYSIIFHMGKEGEVVLRRGLTEKDTYCLRRAILSLAKLNPPDYLELKNQFRNHPDPLVRQSAQELIIRKK